MKTVLVLVALMAAFGVVDRIDYKSQIAMDGNQRDYMEGNR